MAATAIRAGGRDAAASHEGAQPMAEVEYRKRTNPDNQFDSICCPLLPKQNKEGTNSLTQRPCRPSLTNKG